MILEKKNLLVQQINIMSAFKTTFTMLIKTKMKLALMSRASKVKLQMFIEDLQKQVTIFWVAILLNSALTCSLIEYLPERRLHNEN